MIPTSSLSLSLSSSRSLRRREGGGVFVWVLAGGYTLFTHCTFRHVELTQHDHAFTNHSKDVAATLVNALGFSLPKYWIGRVLEEIYH